MDPSPVAVTLTSVMVDMKTTSSATMSALRLVTACVFNTVATKVVVARSPDKDTPVIAIVLARVPMCVVSNVTFYTVLASVEFTSS